MTRGLVGLFLALGLAAAAEEAAPPKSAGLIVFSSNRSGPWHLWTVKPDGSGLRELTKGGPDEHDADAVFSPDAKSILFSSTRGGKVGVWRMPLDAKTAQPELRPPSGSAGASPSQPERICDGDQAEWSPDAARIAFRRDEKLFVRDLAGGAEKCISPKDFPHCSGPAFSPDGKTLAFACRWDAGNAIYTIPADGGEPKKVYDQQGACEPHWAADAKLLLYETETHIATVQPDGKRNRLVTYFGGVQRYARFSPDGKSIVFCQGASEQGPWELYVIPAAGGNPRKLTEGASDMQPDWK